MNIAATSVIAHQLSQDHIARALDCRYFDYIQYVDLAEYNPDVLVFAGWFAEEYADWTLHRVLCGDIPRIVVHWLGLDMQHMDVELAERFYLKGERRMFEELSNPRFVHIPSDEEMGKRLEKMGLSVSAPLCVPVISARRDVPLPTDPPYTVAVSVNPDRLSPRFTAYMNEFFGRIEEAKFLFYSWMPPINNVGFGGYSEEKYALDHDGLDTILDRSNALLMTSGTGIEMTEAAKYLMSGRPVISDVDLPHWPKKITSHKPRKIKGLFEDLKNGIGTMVPDHVREFYADRFDPAKYTERVMERISAQEAKVKAA